MKNKNSHKICSISESCSVLAEHYKESVLTFEKCLENGVTFANRTELCEKGPFSLKKKTLMRCFTIPYDDNVYPKLKFEDGMNVLFIGTGYGTEILTLINQYTSCHLNIWGIDINLDSVRLCHRQNIPAKIVQAVGEELPFPDSSFDIVFLREVIEHVIDPNAVIREIVRVGKPNCQVYIGTPNGASWAAEHLMERLRKQIAGRRYKKRITDNHYTPKEMKKLVRATGGGLVLEKTIFDMPFYFLCQDLPEKFYFLIAIIKRMTNFVQTVWPFNYAYCDQAKYFLKVKKISAGSNKIHDNASLQFVCPHCKYELEEKANGFYCAKCRFFYPETNGILQFFKLTREGEHKQIHDKSGSLTTKIQPLSSFKIKRILLYSYDIFLVGFWVVVFPLTKFLSLFRRRP